MLSKLMLARSKALQENARLGIAAKLDVEGIWLAEEILQDFHLGLWRHEASLKILTPETSKLFQPNLLMIEAEQQTIVVTGKRLGVSKQTGVEVTKCKALQLEEARVQVKVDQAHFEGRVEGERGLMAQLQEMGLQGRLANQQHGLGFEHGLASVGLTGDQQCTSAQEATLKEASKAKRVATKALASGRLWRELSEAMAVVAKVE
ncbi:hypothetical protein ACLOJK_030912 [Asimina triloba]